MLNLRGSSREESSPSSSPAEDPREVEPVESVRRLLESRQPPGLARIRRFVLKPRPRLWRFGVGVWLWLVKIGEWSVRFLRWLGRGAGRVIKVLRLAGFLGRRMQNLGARVGYWGRNWSSAEGRLGRLGSWCAGFGERLVKQGAAFAVFTDGASDLTKRAAEFLAGVVGEPTPEPVLEPAPDGGGPTPGPIPSPAPEREAPSTSAPSSESQPSRGSRPSPARTRSPEASPKPTPTPKPATPPPLPDDIPVYLQPELRATLQTSRPLPEVVRRLILEVTEARGWTRPVELAAWLGFATNYLNRRYLGPMTKAGLLERRYPDRLSHPRQAYRAVRANEPDASPDPQVRGARHVGEQPDTP